jgi:catechol 2,3-dioxygenase-like lactoylglutathione lyase family enzyme
MPILRLDHVQLAIPLGGEDRAREFYAGILGLSEVEKPAPMAGRNSIWFAAGTAKGSTEFLRSANALVCPRDPILPSMVFAASMFSILSAIGSS